MLKTFPTVEDYIEVIAGYRDIDSGKLKDSSGNFWIACDPIISLARYDVSVINSMADSALSNKALTTKQGDLAIRIILKYQRQLAQKGVDVGAVNTPVWRNRLRVMDYTKRMSIQDDQIVIEFPFSDKLIEGLRDFRKDSQGAAEWHKETRQWRFALTEYNLVYLITWAEANQFEIDNESYRLNQLITDVEQTPYTIELDVVDGSLQIRNAASSLNEYIIEHCGGFGIDNLARLVDQAPILGYTVSEDIQTAWMETTNKLNLFLSIHKQTRLNHTDYGLVADVLDYADRTQRWPVVIYESDGSNKMLGELWRHRGRNNVFAIRGRTTVDLDQIKEYRYIHTTTPIRNIDIPLLVSTAGMLFGGDKSLMLQNAEKQVYFSADVHTGNKNITIAEFNASETDNQG